MARSSRLRPRLRALNRVVLIRTRMYAASQLPRLRAPDHVVSIRAHVRSIAAAALRLVRAAHPSSLPTASVRNSSQISWCRGRCSGKHDRSLNGWGPTFRPYLSPSLAHQQRLVDTCHIVINQWDQVRLVWAAAVETLALTVYRRRQQPQADHEYERVGCRAGSDLVRPQVQGPTPTPRVQYGLLGGYPELAWDFFTSDGVVSSTCMPQPQQANVVPLSNAGPTRQDAL